MLSALSQQVELFWLLQIYRLLLDLPDFRQLHGVLVQFHQVLVDELLLNLLLRRFLLYTVLRQSFFESAGEHLKIVHHVYQLGLLRHVLRPNRLLGDLLHLLNYVVASSCLRLLRPVQIPGNLQLPERIIVVAEHQFILFGALGNFLECSLLMLQLLGKFGLPNFRDYRPSHLIGEVHGLDVMDLLPSPGGGQLHA